MDIKFFDPFIVAINYWNRNKSQDPKGIKLGDILPITAVTKKQLLGKTLHQNPIFYPNENGHGIELLKVVSRRKLKGQGLVMGRNLLPTKSSSAREIEQ